jgi:uncharacterized protein (DUF433 family)
VYNSFAMTALDTTLDNPLSRWDDGTIRIKGTRLKLEYILKQFKAGATAEQIQDSYPSATSRDVYGAILYYLQNRVPQPTRRGRRGRDALDCSAL